MVTQSHQHSPRESVEMNQDIFCIDSRDTDYIGRRLHVLWNRIKTFQTNFIVEFYPTNADIVPGFIQGFCNENGLYCNGKVYHELNTPRFRMVIELPPSEVECEKRNKKTFVLIVGFATAVATFVGLTPRNTGMKDFSAITYAEEIEQARIGVRDGVVKCLMGNAGEIQLGDTVYSWPRNANRATETHGNNPDNTLRIKGEDDFLAETILRAPAQVSDNPDLLCEKND